MAPQSPVVVLGLVFFNDFDSEHKDVNDFLIDTKSNITSEKDLWADIYNAFRG